MMWWSQHSVCSVQMPVHDFSFRNNMIIKPSKSFVIWYHRPPAPPPTQIGNREALTSDNSSFCFWLFASLPFCPSSFFLASWLDYQLTTQPIKPTSPSIVISSAKALSTSRLTSSLAGPFPPFQLPTGPTHGHLFPFVPDDRLLITPSASSVARWSQTISALCV
jgi:hypothetical protein